MKNYIFYKGENSVSQCHDELVMQIKKCSVFLFRFWNFFCQNKKGPLVFMINDGKIILWNCIVDKAAVRFYEYFVQYFYASLNSQDGNNLCGVYFSVLPYLYSLHLALACDVHLLCWFFFESIFYIFQIWHCEKKSNCFQNLLF